MQSGLLQARPGLLKLLGIVLLQLLGGLASAELHDVLLFWYGAMLQLQLTDVPQIAACHCVTCIAGSMVEVHVSD